jgi:hypothetical protein
VNKLKEMKKAKLMCNNKIEAAFVCFQNSVENIPLYVVIMIVSVILIIKSAQKLTLQSSFKT